jgi:tRNA A-37 threonylcarbamoyl transferase component Bud32
VIHVDRPTQTATSAGEQTTLPGISAREDGAGKQAAPLIPGYADLEYHNGGGQGAVYRARQEGTNKLVAIKLLHAKEHVSETVRQRFEREIQIAGLLKHPNIVTIFHAGETDGRRYYVMDFVDGKQLDKHASLALIGLHDTLDIFIKICDAVQHAHRNGVIHRDLKPGNILVDRSGEPHVLDFGLARADAFSQAITLTQQIMGTLVYMSPEQTLGDQKAVDTRSDVYTLGVILYRLLTGRFPYPVDGSMELVFRNIRECEPLAPGKIWLRDSAANSVSTWRLFRRRRGIDDDLQTIMLRALAKEPERRYQSAGDFGNDLRRYQQGDPIEARRDSFGYMTRQLLRRHLGKSLALGTLGLVIGGSLFSAGQFAMGWALERQERLDQEAVAKREIEWNRDEAPLTMLAWFLIEYEAGHDHAARMWLERLEMFEPSAPELAAMRHMLQPQSDVDALIAGDLHQRPDLALFAEAIRVERSESRRAAAEFYARAMDHQLPPTLSTMVRSRLGASTAR